MSSGSAPDLGVVYDQCLSGPELLVTSILVVVLPAPVPPLTTPSHTPLTPLSNPPSHVCCYGCAAMRALLCVCSMHVLYCVTLCCSACVAMHVLLCVCCGAYAVARVLLCCCAYVAVCGEDRRLHWILMRVHPLFMRGLHPMSARVCF